MAFFAIKLACLFGGVFVVACIPISTASVLTLEDIVTGVNFARQTIENGEVHIEIVESPRTLLAAVGVVELIRFLKTHIARTPVVYAVLIIVLLVQSLPVLQLHPYYRAYYHPLLSGNWMMNNTSVGGGIGLDSVADYLNRKLNAEQMTVRVSLMSRDFFMPYFVGQTYTTKDVSAHRWPNYDVVYIRDKQVYRLPEDLPRTLEHIIRFNGIDYAWIYRVSQPAPGGRE